MSNHAIERLEKIMDELREQCPWDRKQTIHTLRQLTIEECHELADVITDENWKGIQEELGDILLHIIFYVKIGAEQQQFSFEDVINGICDKLVFRHPHIYGDVVVKDEEEVKRNWENLKLKEGKTSVMSGVPRSLPPMVQAMRIQEKAKQVGFEWENKEQVWEKVNEEIGELQHEVAQNNKEKMEDELGDVFFSLINYARFLNIDPETALEKTNKKFKHRFELMETYAKENGLDLAKLSLEEKEAIWQSMKSK
jgi:MazG family protein